MKHLKTLLIIAGLFSLSACATRQSPLQGKPHLPVKNEPELVGRSAGDIKQTFGDPISMREEEPNQIWTYKKGQCVVFMYFEDETVVFAQGRGQCKALTPATAMKG